MAETRSRSKLMGATIRIDFQRIQVYFYLFILTLQLLCALATDIQQCGPRECHQGVCQHQNNNTDPQCQCFTGWKGSECKQCDGRVRLTAPEGYITDGQGNYSLNSKCTWLVESGYPGTRIQFEFKQFATECGWDHLYIYDGNSAFDKLVGVVSGLVMPHSISSNISNPLAALPYITTHSGSAFIHFYSDVAYNMSGFLIHYRMDSCPKNCSNNGQCVNNTCQCDAGWTGKACDFATCLNNCNDKGTCVNGRCNCRPDYTGPSCTHVKEGFWDEVEQRNSIVGRASHKSVVVGDAMWVTGGQFMDSEGFQQLAKYNFGNKSWNSITPSPGRWPMDRYGHSLVHYNGKLIMFGGLLSNGSITDELWEYTISTNTWAIIPQHLPTGGSQKVKAVVGHSAHVIGIYMYVFFGHSPVYGYTSYVQRCRLDTTQAIWELLSTGGATVKGGYGHSSVYDEQNQMVYIHGGYASDSLSTYVLLDVLYSFNVTGSSWRILRSSGLKRYLHSAVLINGLMLVFGGNVHNDTNMSQGAKCHSSEFLAYDLKCDNWIPQVSPDFSYDVARFGHSAVVHDRKMYVFGGFKAVMLNDILSFTPGDCKKYKSRDECLAARPGTTCVYVGSECLAPHQANANKMQPRRHEPTCNPAHRPDDGESRQVCHTIQSCVSCVETSYNCTWCEDRCSWTGNCPQSGKEFVAKKTSDCKGKDSGECEILHNCHACTLNENCGWHKNDNKCYRHGGESMSVQGQTESTDNKCGLSCHTHRTCENCTQNNCMWCSNRQRCVESNSYVASFPFGQCMEWATKRDKCPATRCSDLGTCKQCLGNPKCGWCDDGSGTGLGRCMEGSADTPIGFNISEPVPAPWKCPSKQWFFVNCPLCQCNGHSVCVNGTNQCEACQHNTAGEKCDRCVDGYYGIPVNGGNCTACECNDHADVCNNTSGRCFCRTRGITGDKCDTCDKDYFGNPRGGGTCYYNLAINFQFTFNLSKKDDKYYTRINFKNMPNKADSDVDFFINCSQIAYVNITIRSKNIKGEQVLEEMVLCRDVRRKFSHRDFVFSSDANTTFFVYVQDFTTPFWLKISFSQMPKIDLVHFFVTFFSCFLSLLLIAAIIWKVKSRYDVFRRRRMEFVQMEQRASRPFAACLIEVDDPYLSDQSSLLRSQHTHSDTRGSRRKKHLKKPTPSPVAMEPLHGNKTAVVSLVFILPKGDEEFTPPGSSGLVVGSSLVTVGHSGNRRTSIDRADRTRKKPMNATSPDDHNCV